VQFRVRLLVPIASLATIAGASVPLSGVAQQPGVCDQAIAEAGTGEGAFGGYELIPAPDVGRSGSQVVVGTAGSDRLVGGSGNDVLCGLGGDDVLDGGSGHDQLEGGDGSDVLQGGSGNDDLDGGPGFDRLFGGSGNDTLRNGEVNDGGSGRTTTTPTPPADISSSLPRVTRDELTGDFLGRGYDQHMRAENTSLNIYDSPSRGGALLQSTPMDLAPAPDGGVATPCDNEFGCQATTWADFGQESTNGCEGCFQFLWTSYELNTIYLARNQNIFMSGTKGNAFEPLSGQTQYQNLVYVLPGDGSCASASCAFSTISLPYVFNLCDSCGGEPRAIGVTSLAAGNVGGNQYLAVGLSDGGVQIYDVGDEDFPRLTSTFTGMGTPDGSQTPATALAWDPSGSGLLAVGVISWADEGFFVQVNGNGIVQPNWLAWSQHGTAALSPAPMSAAFGQRQDGSPVVAFGMREGSGQGTLRLVDPRATGPETTELSGSSPGPDAIIAINPIPRFDGTVGGSDYAVSYAVPSASGNGGLLRWDGTSSALTALPVTAGSPNTLSPDWDSFRAWYPGIKQGRFTVSNTSGEPVTVALQTSSSPGLGCWYAPSWADAPAFPAAGVTVAGGQASAMYTMGAYTAGASGGCAATDVTGTWRGYLVVTPVNHPADARLVGLRLNRDMTVDVTDQAGGATSVSIVNAHQQFAAFGLWTVVVDTPAAPTPQQQPTVTGSRVTPAGTPGPAVYRFDVSGATYDLANPYPNQLELPPLFVQGSLDGTTWTDLGTLVPATEPTIAAGSPARLQLGPATFWWENATGQPAYEHVRVTLGPAGTPSTAVTLADLAPPSAVTNVSGPSIAATSSTGVAAPVDSGVDQAPLSVQVLDHNSAPLPATDPSYQRIYYRDTANTLITNLFRTGVDVNNFIGVSPYAGAYSNNGSASGGQPGSFDGFHYVSTTSTIDQRITGYIAINATPPTFSLPIEVHATAIGPVTSATSAADGISLAGCADFTGSTLCRLFPISPSDPALYLNTVNGVELGLLTAASATTAVSSLPLPQTAGTTEHALASAPLTVSDTAATLTDTSAFQPSDHVDTALVTHGEFVPVVNVPVAG